MINYISNRYRNTAFSTNEAGRQEAGCMTQTLRVKITLVNGAHVICQAAKVNLWVLDEKWILATCFAIKDHNNSIWGFDVLNDQICCLPDGSESMLMFEH